MSSNTNFQQTQFVNSSFHHLHNFLVLHSNHLTIFSLVCLIIMTKILSLPRLRIKIYAMPHNDIIKICIKRFLLVSFSCAISTFLYLHCEQNLHDDRLLNSLALYFFTNKNLQESLNIFNNEAEKVEKFLVYFFFNPFSKGFFFCTAQGNKKGFTTFLIILFY